MKRDNRIWQVAYTANRENHIISDLTKAEAKRIWGGLLQTFGKNLIMSAECKEAYLQRSGKVIAFKSGDDWYINGTAINNLYETKEEILALI